MAERLVSAIRRLRHALSQRSVVGVLLEITIVVLGILIAFALDAAWDWRQERREEQSALRSLHAEFVQTRADLSQWIAFHRKTERNTHALIGALGAVETGAYTEVPDTLLAALLIGPTFDPITATLDALTNSGRLPILESQLRAALASWPARLLDARDEELQARRFIDEELIPHLAAHADDLRPYGFVAPWIYGTLPDSLKSRATSLRVTPELRNMMGIRLYYGSGARAELESLAHFTDELLLLLDSVVQ